ncbi:MAG: hypothetical protein P1U77_11315, partial [Rubripirellula sp.]|nr:hypothetical protein [Rubripirellula sp.]
MSHVIPRLTCVLLACLLTVPALADDPPTGQQEKIEQQAEADPAKQQAEAEAKKKADEEAKQKAEAEAKKKADEEKKKAE